MTWNDYHKTNSSPAAGGTGYKVPPKASQYKPGQSGNPHRGKSAIKSLKEMVMSASSKLVTVTDSTGKTRKVPADEVLIERTFHDAIKRKPKAVKQILKCCEQYLPPYEEPPEQPTGGGYTFLPLGQSDVDDWRDNGFLPAHCPYAIEDIDSADLTRAARASAAARQAAEALLDEP